MMEHTQKVWGPKFNIFQNDLCEISYMPLKKWHRCSWHRHQEKYNLFFVISGKLYIKTEEGTAEILSGGVFTTRPGEWHEFQTHEDEAQVIEVMYVRYSAGDIERKNVGGEMERPSDFKYHMVCLNCKKEIMTKDPHSIPLCKPCLKSMTEVGETEAVSDFWAGHAHDAAGVPVCPPGKVWSEELRCCVPIISGNEGT